MAEQPNLEELAKQLQAKQQPKEEKKEETIDDKVAFNSWQSVLEAGAVTTLGIASGGFINYASVAGVYLAVNWLLNKSKTTTESMMAEFKTAGVVTICLKYVFDFLNHFKGSGSALSQFTYTSLGYLALVPAYNVAYHAIDYFFKSGKSLINYALKPWRFFTSYAGELYEKRLKSDYLKSTTSTLKLVPAVSTIVTVAPRVNLGDYMIALVSGIRFMYRMALGGGSDDDKRSFTQYVKEGLSDFFTFPADKKPAH
jgi:hypothetical protein